MTRRSDRGAPLVILEADPGGVTFQTDGPATYVSETSLDAARLHCHRFGFAYLNKNAIDESDLGALHNEIRQARERYALMDGCRRDGCENRTDRGDGLCGLHAEVAEDVSARIRRTA